MLKNSSKTLANLDHFKTVKEFEESKGGKQTAKKRQKVVLILSASQWKTLNKLSIFLSQKRDAARLVLCK